MISHEFKTNSSQYCRFLGQKRKLSKPKQSNLKLPAKHTSIVHILLKQERFSCLIFIHQVRLVEHNSEWSLLSCLPKLPSASNNEQKLIISLFHFFYWAFGFSIFTYGRTPIKWTTLGDHPRCWARQNIKNVFAKYELKPIKTCHKAWPCGFMGQLDISMQKIRSKSQHKVPMRRVATYIFASRLAETSCV